MDESANDVLEAKTRPRNEEQPILNRFRVEGTTSTDMAETCSTKARSVLGNPHTFRNQKPNNSASCHGLGALLRSQFSSEFYLARVENNPSASSSRVRSGSATQP